MQQPFEIALPMLLYYAFGFTFLTWLGRRLRFSPADTVALSYGAMTKNRSMATAIAIAIFSPMTVTAIALAGVVALLPAMQWLEQSTRYRRRKLCSTVGPWNLSSRDFS